MFVFRDSTIHELHFFFSKYPVYKGLSVVFVVTQMFAMSNINFQ